MSRIMVLLALASAASPGVAQKVRVDYDHGCDFSRYKTYRWVELQRAQSPDVQFPNQLMQERIVGFVEEALAAKQFTRVETGGDLLVGYAMKVTCGAAVHHLYRRNGTWMGMGRMERVWPWLLWLGLGWRLG